MLSTHKSCAEANRRLDDGPCQCRRSLNWREIPSMKPSDRFVWNLEKRKWPPGSSRTAATAAGRTRTPKAARTHCRTACGSGGHCPVGRRKGRAAVALPVPTRFAIRPGPHSDERRKELVNKFVIQRGGRERSGDVRVHPCRSPPPGDSEKLRKYDN